MARATQKPYALTGRQLRGFDSHDDLARWLVEEINHALEGRPILEQQLDYWHRIYEQGRTRLTRNTPRPDGADLTSPLGTQYVDALHADAMQTVFGVEPVWTVEGWADSVQRAPFVEEFHQWTAEDERVQSYVDRALKNAWVDSVGILECFEETDMRPVRKTIWAQLETQPDEFGQPRAVFGEDNRPILVRDAKGAFVEVPAPPEGAPVPQGIAQVEIDSMEPVRVGPGYSVIDYADFLTLPAHAREARQLWGYAKRFHRRVPYLMAKAKEGMYAKDAVEAIGDESERETTMDDTRRGVTVVTQEGHTAEKELWEVAFLRDLDGSGERWWVATVHVGHQKLLRLVYDDLATQIGFGRFVRFVPFPRKNSVDGHSVIGHKLLTLIEEHTAIRNMRADGASIAGSAPLKVRAGALYDPDQTPLGAGTILYVRDMDEVQAMQLPDLPRSIDVWERSVFDGAERTIGKNDISTGVTPSQNRTLGERRLQTGFAAVRTGVIVRRIQESMEELGQIRHVIWKRTLASQGEMDIPQSIQSGLEARGQDVDAIPGGKITADMLEGKFKFKPRGSVETADLEQLRQDFVQMIQMLPALFQTNPMIAAQWQTPQAARALNEQLVKLFRFPDRQAVLGTPAQMAGGTAQLLQDPRLAGLLGGGGAPLGAPAGGPPPGVPPSGGAPPPQIFGQVA